MKTYLKIKGLTLAQEARIIKKIEQNRRTNPNLRAQLHKHRTVDVRNEARSTHIALGFLRGTTMQQMERPLKLDRVKGDKNFTRTAPNWKRIEQLVNKYGGQYFDNPQALAQAFAEFKDTGSVGVQD